jgi:hypothetical protein
MGSNMAENHPVGFQWVIEARERGAKVFHIDPRFTRTSAMASGHVRIRAGSDIAFLGGIVNYILEHEREFREYVVHYTNAPVIVREDFKDTEDLDGFFSGWDPKTGKYDPATWQYAGMSVPGAAGQREIGAPSGEQAGHGGHGAALDHGEPPAEDRTLRHPRCVFQLLKKHYRRYTPAVVAEICGCSEEDFLEVAESLCANSGRDRTSAFAYSVGWTQHSIGVQYIRTAAIIQLLLGNVGRPGGGILALRGHASIQGSTDNATLYNVLPGYLSMPHAHAGQGLKEFVELHASPGGYWGDVADYFVSLLKAYWGAHATPDNDFCFGYLPRLTGDHSNYQAALDMLDGKMKGYFLLGENPAVGSANARLHRLALARLDWLVVRDLNEIESATFWYDAPEIETGELVPDRIPTEVFFLPAAAHTEKDGCFTNTQRLLQWHHKAVEPRGDCRSELWFMYHLGRRIRERLAGSEDPKDRPVLELRWEYSAAKPPVRVSRPGEGGFGGAGRFTRLGALSGAERRGGAAGDQRCRAGRQGALRLHGAQARRVDVVRVLDLLRVPRGRGQPAGPAQARGASRAGWRRSGGGPGRRTGACSTTAPPQIRTVSPGRSGRGTSGGTRRGVPGRARTFPTSFPTGRRTTRLRTTLRARTPSPATTRSSCRRMAAAGSSSPRVSSTGHSRRTTNRTSRPSRTCSTASEPIRRDSGSRAPRTRPTRAARSRGRTRSPTCSPATG